MSSTNSKIAQIVNGSLSGYSVPQQYRSVVDTVIENLSAAAEEVADTLRTEGTRLGASAQQVDAALVRSGLVNEPEPEPEVAQPESADDRLSKIEGLVQRLVAAAEARGLRI
jgi:hypothetical protein